MATGCTGSGTTVERPGGTAVRVRSFTEAAPVELLLAAPPYAFAASAAGLELEFHDGRVPARPAAEPPPARPARTKRPKPDQGSLF